jgi:Na+/proline symporter
VAGLVLAGLWAADVSTASALLIGSATLVVGDLIKRFVAPDLKEREERIISRISVLVLSIITYLLALSVSGILKTLLIGLSLTTAYSRGSDDHFLAKCMQAGSCHLDFTRNYGCSWLLGGFSSTSFLFSKAQSPSSHLFLVDGDSGDFFSDRRYR